MNNKLKLMVIDDSLDDPTEERRTIYTTILSNTFEIVFVDNGRDLDDKIKEAEVDGYLVDIVLKNWKKNGKNIEIFEVLKLINEKNNKPIILVSKEYDSLLNRETNTLTDLMNDFLQAGFSIKQFLRWSEFDTEYRYIKENESKFALTISNNIQVILLSQKDKNADIAVIAALNEELNPFNELMENIQEYQISNIPYKRGEIKTENGKSIKIVTVQQQEQGNVEAALISMLIAKEFNIKDIFMIGVCGGRKDNDIRYGTIVIPNESIAYQKGKYTNEGLKLDIGIAKTNKQTRAIFSESQCRDVLIDIKKKCKYKFKKESIKEYVNSNNLNIYFEEIACGDIVIDKRGELKELAKKTGQRKMKAVDMESYAIFKLHEIMPSINVIVIKSIMDYSGSGGRKRDLYKDYAAFISANFLHQVLKNEIYKI